MTTSPDVPAGTGPEERAALRDLAETLAREAGDVVRARAAGGVRVSATKSSVNDVVTAVDTEVEALLRARLAELRPGDGVLGEEEGAVVGTSGLTWVLDPVDGTVNFVYGIPSFAVSVAVVTGGTDPLTWRPLAGSVHAITLGTTWSAAEGLGATRDGAPLALGPAPVLGQALVGTGFAYTAARRAVQARALAKVLPAVRDIRRIGSAAIDLCLVADGRLDAHYELGLNPWDMAAGALVLTEAGGQLRLTRPAGHDGDPLLTVAGPAPLVDELDAAVREAFADALTA